MTNAKKRTNNLLFLTFILGLSSVSFYSHADGCVNNGGN